jgi:hypothetical protein
MRIIKQLQLLMGLALLGGAGLALADVPATVLVVGAGETSPNCKEVTPERARALADKAWHDGAYQRSGECYVAAGDHALANEAFVKASAQTGGDTSKRLAANLSDFKAQARQMKQALQHR